MSLEKIRRWYRRHSEWIPIQACFVCGKLFWAGLPWFGWRPSWNDYCSRECADIDMEVVDSLYEEI